VQVTGYDLGTDARRLDQISSARERSRVEIVRGDITDIDALELVIDERAITHVIHLAALQIPFCRADPVTGAQVNVVGTTNVFEAVKRRPGRFGGPVVYASSAAVYGAAPPGGPPAPEDLSGEPPATLYGVFKVANEGTARVFAAEYGVASIGLRPVTVYGPGRDQGITAAPTLAMRAAVRGEEFHVPYGGRSSFQYGPDVARAFIAAARSGHTGASVANVAGADADIAQVLDVIAREEPAARDLLSADPTPLPLPEAFEVGAFARIVGPLPLTPLADGVRETMEFFRTHPEV
jgi:UDP-glucuronate 4-epimerase